MSGKLKKTLAILAALGITASGVTEFLTHVMSTFPTNTKLHAVCTMALTLLGLAAAIFPASVLPPAPGSSPDADKTPAESPNARTKQAGSISAPWLLLIGALAFGGLALLLAGCATTATPPGSTLAQKIKDDATAAQQIATDVEQKCGPQFKSLAPVLADILAAAKDPTNVLGDVLDAIDAYAPLKADVTASLCVLHTVVADIKALTPAKAAALDRMVAQVEARQSL